jgi:SAM-dependent methyltransferase
LSIHEERWEKIFQERKFETYYPFDEVVSFVFRNFPKDKQRSEVKILEIGCGLGNNMKFMSEEGFDVTGIDVSETAINRANEIFNNKGLKASFVCGSCAEMPFESESYDLIVDHGCLAVLPDEVFTKMIKEVSRVIKPSGRFLISGAYTDCSSANEIESHIVDGLVDNIIKGHLSVRERGIRFFSFNDLRSLFYGGWKFISVVRTESMDMISFDRTLIAQWTVVVEKL